MDPTEENRESCFGEGEENDDWWESVLGVLVTFSFEHFQAVVEGSERKR